MLGLLPETSSRASGLLVSRSSRTSLSVALLSLLVACAAPTPTPHVLKSPSASPKSATPLPQAIFVRPSTGPTITPYNSTRSKGIDIAGNAGDPVVAAANGRVVFVGDQLRGYGQMVIIKHDETFLTAYAHNQIILVRENDTVVKNQKIAEMGQTDADRVKLHFEIRKNGVAVDPEAYLNGKLH